MPSCMLGAAGNAGQTSCSERVVAQRESGGEWQREEGALPTEGENTSTPQRASLFISVAGPTTTLYSKINKTLVQSYIWRKVQIFNSSWHIFILSRHIFASLCSPFFCLSVDFAFCSNAHVERQSNWATCRIQHMLKNKNNSGQCVICSTEKAQKSCQWHQNCEQLLK